MIIIDTSVAVKWIQEEANRDKACALQRDHLEKRNEIIVPQLLFYEVANTLVTKFSLSSEYIEEGLGFIYRSHLTVYQEEENDMIQASLLAKKHNTSVYDMLYAVVAIKHKTVLITADERFHAKTKFPFVRLLSEYKI